MIASGWAGCVIVTRTLCLTMPVPLTSFLTFRRRLPVRGSGSCRDLSIFLIIIIYYSILFSGQSALKWFMEWMQGGQVVQYAQVWCGGGGLLGGKL